MQFIFSILNFKLNLFLLCNNFNLQNIVKLHYI